MKQLFLNILFLKMKNNQEELSFKNNFDNLIDYFVIYKCIYQLKSKGGIYAKTNTINTEQNKPKGNFKGI